MTTRNLVSALAALAFLTLAAQTHAATLSANPSNYRTLLNTLQPGDTLQLAAGTYTEGLPLANKSGTASAPIIIRGPDDQSALLQARVQLRDTSYVQVMNLTLDGVDSSGSSHDITLENLKIIDHSGNPRTVGISSQGAAWNWVIRRNVIIGAGTGIYLGNSEGIIEYNAILDTIGSNMEIGPAEHSGTILRHNVFAKRSSTLGNDGARPNVLVSTGANELDEVYGNFFYQNPTGTLFQGEGNIALHDNVFVNSAGDAVNIQARNVAVYNNTVVATGSGLRISGAADTKIIGNVSFAGAPISAPNQQNNILGTYAQAATYLNAPTAAIGSLDLRPKTGQLTGTALDLSPFSAFTDGAKDFNGTTRTGTRRGAYEGDGTKSGWKLALATMPAVAGTGRSPDVTIAAANSTTVTISASPMQINAGDTSLLSWTSTNAAGCSASNGWSGSKGPNGTQTVGPLQSTTTFQLDCFGTDQASATVTVTVGGGGSTPNPPQNPPTTPPPGDSTPTNPPPSSPAKSGGGGGSLDLSVLAVLTLLACATVPARAATGRKRAS